MQGQEFRTQDETLIAAKLLQRLRKMGIVSADAELYVEAMRMDAWG